MAIPSPCARFSLAGVFADVNFSKLRSLNCKKGRSSQRISSYSYSAKRYSVKRYSYSLAVELRRCRSLIESKNNPQHGPCSCKFWPRRHKADGGQEGLVGGCVSLPSGLPGGGVTNSYRACASALRHSPFFLFCRLAAKKKTDPQHGPCSCKSWPRRHKADGGQEGLVGGCVSLPSGLPGGGITFSYRVD